MQFVKKTAGLRSGIFSDLNSACSKMLVTVKIFQFHDMLNESERYRVTANGLIGLFPNIFTHDYRVEVRNVNEEGPS
jgi:hypothetical protein